ncbi:MAG: MSMEG_4193 family putative phosphomutase, partial [Candidatus Nanopelagicales bacterium]
HLDHTGVEQAAPVATRLAPVRLAAVVSSPLERTVQTAEAIASRQQRSLDVELDERLGECRYGEWTNQRLADLSKLPLWKTVQEQPSAVTFPDGESLPAMQARAIGAVHDWNQQLGDRAAYVLVSHGDVIKSIVADALGMHLDQFQRIVIDPASVSVIRYGKRTAQVVHVNDRGSDLSTLGRSRRRVRADVGGGSGER